VVSPIVSPSSFYMSGRTKMPPARHIHPADHEEIAVSHGR